MVFSFFLSEKRRGEGSNITCATFSIVYYWDMIWRRGGEVVRLSA